MKAVVMFTALALAPLAALELLVAMGAGVCGSILMKRKLVG